MGKAANALKYLQQALDIYIKSANPREAARVRALMGQAYQQQGLLGPARQEYQQALQEFIELSDRLNQAAVYYMLGRLESRSGNLDAAEEYFRQSIETTEKIRRLPSSSDLAAGFSATIHDRYENYIECLMLKDRAQPTLGFAVRAFETSELARARSLAEMLRATQTNLSLLARAYKKEELEALDGELTRLESEYQQITETIRQHYPAYEQISRPTAPDLRQIQEHVIVDDETLLLEYSLGEEKSYVWAVTRNDISSAELPAQKFINEPAQKVYELLAVPPSAETEKKLTEAARELSQMILSPVAAQLNKQRIIVVADGVLNFQIGAQASFAGYQKYQLGLSAPGLAKSRVFLTFNFIQDNFPQEDFFGIGSDSDAGNRTSYRLEESDYSGSIGVHPVRKLDLGARGGILNTNVGHGTDVRFPSTEEAFNSRATPGLDQQPHYKYAGAFVKYDRRDQPLNPRSGGLYRVEGTYYRDRKLGAYGFRRWSMEIQQYFPFFNERRVIAFRGKLDLTNANSDQQVPFFLMPTVGGSEDLRGYREFRFRDKNAVVFNLEYRWEAFSGLDLALFGDAGNVFQEADEIRLNKLKTSYGFGFRFNTEQSVFWRIDFGFSPEGMRPFVKFNHVF